MKTYINTTRRMVIIEFTNGTCVFLRRGQRIDTTETPKDLPKGVVVQEIKTKKTNTTDTKIKEE